MEGFLYPLTVTIDDPVIRQPGLARRTSMSTQ